MSPKFLAAFGGGVLLLGFAVWFGLFSTKDSRLELTGEVLKVRTMELTPATTMAVLDFRMKNESNVLFILKEATISWKDAEGAEHEADPIAKPDVDRIMQYARQIGPKLNEMFVMREKLTSKAMVDRMQAGVIKAAEAEFAKRKSLTLRLTDLDGKSFTFSERAPSGR